MKTILLGALLLTALAVSDDAAKIPWPNGEQLSFRLSWGFVTAGSADMIATPLSDGKFLFESVARNNGAFKSIYPVAELRFLSQHFATTFRPQKFESDFIRHGFYKCPSPRCKIKGGYDHIAERLRTLHHFGVLSCAQYGSIGKKGYLFFGGKREKTLLIARDYLWKGVCGNGSRQV